MIAGTSMLKSLSELFELLGPVQSIIWITVVILSVYFWIMIGRLSSFNPKHYPDEYVKSHMAEFYSWFQKHPEDRPRYE